MGVMLINVTQALGEMAILYPVSGGFYTLASRMLDPSFAFAMGWNYVLQWAVVLPLEITVAGTTVMYWNTPVPLGAWITIFFFLIIVSCSTPTVWPLLTIQFVSVLGTLGYAEEEFWSSCLKLAVVVIFIIIGIVCISGKGPKGGAYDSYVGGRHWSNPGAFANGFKGVCAVFVTAAFSFAGTELVGLAATETPNPRATMPAAVKQTFCTCGVCSSVSSCANTTRACYSYLRHLAHHHRSCRSLRQRASLHWFGCRRLALRHCDGPGPHSRLQPHYQRDHLYFGSLDRHVVCLRRFAYPHCPRRDWLRPQGLHLR